MNERENLLARSERVIGRPLSADEQSSTTSRAQRGSSQRREQVLKAQRTHRHRTQQYIRELEKEVFRLRDENEAMHRALHRRTQQITHLKDLLMKNSIPVDIKLDPDVETFESTHGTDHESRSTSEGTSSINIDLRDLSEVIPQGSCENHPAEIEPPVYKISEDSSPSLNSTKRSLETQDAIEFILALEKPCLPHVKHAHLGYSTGTTPHGINYNSGPGHLLTISAGLVRQFRDQNPAESVMHIQADTLDRLLAASKSLKLNDEITPVQIWARIQDLPCDVSTADLERLLKHFTAYVYCNSFGAVVEKSTALAVLAEHFNIQETQLPILQASDG